MDLKPRRRAPNFVEEDEEAIRGKHQYYPFSSSSTSATTAASPVPYSGGFTVGSNHHRPQMVTWLGDLKLKTGDDNPIQFGEGSMKNDRFMDLSMNLKCHQEADEEEGDGGDMINREVVVEKQHMFDKVVTPSDVGKLNRLVIPKQHAERFFPLDPLTSEKGGLLLSFEDRTGKPWRFRYSYWNSSQSYVMTKGWSRFVKEKKLDAGDIVSFLRGIVDKDRLFIDWRHRPNARLEVPMSISYPGALSFPHSFSFHQPAPTGMWNINDPGNFRRDHHHMGLTAIKEVGLNPSRTNIYGNIINSALRDGSVIYPRSSAAAPAGRGSRTYGDGIEPPAVFDSVPVGQGEKGVMAPSKRQLRLFGVNMDCSMLESYESETPDHSSSQYTQDPTSSVYNGMSLQPNNEWLDKDRGPTSS